MEFLPTVANNTPLWMNLLALGVTGLVILSLLVILVSIFFKNSLVWLLEPLTIGYIFFLIIFAAVSGFIYVGNARAHEGNLQSNLLQKYDIVSVDYDSELAPLKIIESESQLITVNLEDGKKGNFLLTQNSRTNEPTLSELPESAVSLEEITR